MGVYLAQKLLPQREVRVRAAPERRHGGGVFFDAAHPRAPVRRLEVDRHPRRRDELDQRVGDLLPDSLLDREALAEETHEPGQLRDTDDLLTRDIADVRDAVERQRMMLAERVEGDWSLDDLAELAGTSRLRLRGKCRQQLRVAVVAGGRIEQRAKKTLRRVARARRIELET